MEKYINSRIDEDQQIYLVHGDYDKYDTKKLVEYINSLIRDGTISFPYKKYFVGNPKVIFQKLISHQMEYYNTPIPNFENQKYYIPDGFGCMVTAEKEYEIDLVSDIFQEKARLTARKKNKVSPLEDWPFSSRKVLYKIINNRKNINPENLREYLYLMNGNYLECTQFKPTVAKEIYDRFEAKNVLDLSSGWGDRLIGAIASDSVESYTGFDPNKSLKSGHDKMIETFCPLNGKTPNLFNIEYIGFEHSNLQGKTFDMMFTSPPFFDFEVYSNDEQQSINTNSTFDSWIKNFLFSSIDKCWKHLSDYGKLIIYIGDTPGSQPTIPMNIHIDQYKDSKFLGSTCFASSFNGKLGRMRYVWVWEKDPLIKKQNKNFLLKLYPEIFN